MYLFKAWNFLGCYQDFKNKNSKHMPILVQPLCVCLKHGICLDATRIKKKKKKHMPIAIFHINHKTRLFPQEYLYGIHISPLTMSLRNCHILKIHIFLLSERVEGPVYVCIGESIQSRCSKHIISRKMPKLQHQQIVLQTR